MVYIKEMICVEDSIGKRIKAIRKKKKLTQIQLAEKAYISESYIALIELDKRNPSTDVIIRLAEILGVSSDYLLFGDTTKNDTAFFREWKELMAGRTPKEIEAANTIIKIFFDNIDNCNKT